MSGGRLPKTEPEGFLIPTAVCETRTGGLGLTDATAVVTPVYLWLVEAKHDAGAISQICENKSYCIVLYCM